MTQAVVMADGTNGEARERARRGRLYLIIGGLLAAGFASGFALALAEGDDAGWLEGPIPLWVAILLSTVWLVSIGGGGWAYMRNCDELEISNNLWATAIGGGVMMVGYPVWYLLWRGETVPEPNAHILFLTLYVVMLAAYSWKKLR